MTALAAQHVSLPECRFQPAANRGPEVVEVGRSSLQGASDALGIEGQVPVHGDVAKASQPCKALVKRGIDDANRV